MYRAAFNMGVLNGKHLEVIQVISEQGNVDFAHPNAMIELIINDGLKLNYPSQRWWPT